MTTDDQDVAKTKGFTKDTSDLMISYNIFPQKYLTNLETDEGLLALMRSPESEAVRGVYFHPVRTDEVRGKIVASHISTRSAASLTGF